MYEMARPRAVRRRRHPDRSRAVALPNRRRARGPAWFRRSPGASSRCRSFLRLVPVCGDNAMS